MRSSPLLSWAPLVALALVGATTSGCHSSTETSGELGDGKFSYECVDTADAACADGDLDPPSFPRVLAVGGRFRLGYRDTAQGDFGGFPEQASASFVSGSLTTSFQVLREGQVAFVGHTTIADEQVVSDFLYFTLVQPRKLAVTQLVQPGVTAGQIKVGGNATFRATPTDDTGTTLAGALRYVWAIKTDDTAQVVATTDATTATTTVTASAPGTIHLVVQIENQDVVSDSTIEVTP